VTRDNHAGGDGMAAFSVDAKSSLTTVPGSPFSARIDAQSLLVDSAGKYLDVADDSCNGYIDAFSISQGHRGADSAPRMISLPLRADGGVQSRRDYGAAGQ
jgi:hypothetical protein